VTIKKFHIIEVFKVIETLRIELNRPKNKKLCRLEENNKKCLLTIKINFKRI